MDGEEEGCVDASHFFKVPTKVGEGWVEMRAHPLALSIVPSKEGEGALNAECCWHNIEWHTTQHVRG